MQPFLIRIFAASKIHIPMSQRKVTTLGQFIIERQKEFP
jgi:hypothetical protein